MRSVDADALEQFVRGGAGSTFKRKEARKRDGEDMDVEQQQKVRGTFSGRPVGSLAGRQWQGGRYRAYWVRSKA